MGYYTRFSGSLSGPSWATDEVENFIEYHVEDGEYRWLDVFVDPDNLETMKWYDWRDDCVALSKKFPAVLFALEGEGEESGDVWKAWIRNGKSVHVQGKIIFEEPDLDAELPTPDMEALKEKRRQEIEAEYHRRLKELREEYNRPLDE